MKTLKIMFLFNLLTYTVVYIVYTYVMWEFKNPFQWIIDIPTYDYERRGMLLFCAFLYYMMLFVMTKPTPNPE